MIAAVTLMTEQVLGVAGLGFVLGWLAADAVTGQERRRRFLSERGPKFGGRR